MLIRFGRPSAREPRANYSHIYEQLQHTGRISALSGVWPQELVQRSTRGDIAHRREPLSQQVVGHAVRAAYLYSARANLTAEDGDEKLLTAGERLFRHLTTKPMYVMGGIGSSMKNVGFTSDYDLPNESA